jgi:hypothetical protein
MVGTGECSRIARAIEVFPVEGGGYVRKETRATGCSIVCEEGGGKSNRL